MRVVECFHRLPKAGLKVHAYTRWTEALPLVLLGIRTAVKSDLGCSTVELVYGTTIRLPGAFVAPSKRISDLDPNNFVHRLKRHMHDLQPPPTRSQHRQPQIHPDLHTCTHVFVRHDAVRTPMQSPYDGPYPVL